MLRSLQAGRGIAALLVVLFHASSICALSKYYAIRPVGSCFAFAGAGVDFFFVLSGFIIAHVHASDVGRPKQLHAYLRKRLTRIYPIYWAALLPLLPVYFLVPSLGTGRERDVGNIVCSLLLIPQPEGAPVLGVAWSLCYEMFFYALFALLIAGGRWGRIVWAAWLVLVVAGLYEPFVAYPWWFLGSPYHVQFLAGVAVALLVRRYHIPWPRRLAVCGAVVFLATGMSEVAQAQPRGIGQLLGYMAGSALLVAGLVETERSHGVRVPRWLVFLGDASYPIYLTHYPALSLLAKLGTALHLHEWIPGPLLFCLMACAATLTGCVFHLLVERPLIRYFRRPAPMVEPAPQRRAA